MPCAQSASVEHGTAQFVGPGASGLEMTVQEPSPGQLWPPAHEGEQKPYVPTLKTAMQSDPSAQGLSALHTA